MAGTAVDGELTESSAAGCERVPPRLGPRPLAFYLQLAGTVAPAQAERFLAGVRVYWAHPYRRRAMPRPVLWQDGGARLLDFGGTGRPILVVPSLINRADVLDLLPRRSLLAHLRDAGFRPLLLDWGFPQATELGFTMTQQIHGRARAALDAALHVTGEPPVLLGYCLGGLIAAGLAAARGRDLPGLALLATPWDFHAGGTSTRPSADAMPQLTAAIATLGHAPVDLLQGFFASLDPLAVIAKYARFAALAPDAPRAELFVAIEDWLNDGVPLAGPVAQECLLDWYGRNLPGKGLWAPGGIVVEPARLELPVFVAVPERDRIVPTASAEAILRGLPHATLARPAAGHVSMIVGDTAERELWRPLVQWLRRIAPRRPASSVPAASATA
jgi:poly(3-hydroxyalkanoate) synthetase